MKRAFPSSGRVSGATTVKPGFGELALSGFNISLLQVLAEYTF